MALAPDATSSYTTVAAGTTATWAHTCTGSDRLLFVMITQWANDDANKCTGVTYNAVALTKVADSGRGPGGDYVQVWRLIAPSTGANNIVATFGGSNRAGCSGAISFTDGHQTVPEGTAATATGNSATASCTVTSATGEYVVGGMSTDATSATIGAGQTSIYGADVGGEYGSAAREDGAASVTFSWTLTSNTWAIAGISVKGAGGAATPTGYMTPNTGYWGA